MGTKATDNFRACLLAALTERGLSYREFAATAKMSHAYVHRIVSGETKPGLQACERIANVLGLSVAGMLQPQDGNADEETVSDEGVDATAD